VDFLKNLAGAGLLVATCSNISNLRETTESGLILFEDTRAGVGHKVRRQDADRIKAAIGDSFGRKFAEELQAAGYALASKVDPKGNNEDLLFPAIINLDVEAPGTQAAGRYRTYATSAGSMTLGIEFRDSITGAVLGEVLDSRPAPD
jgi:hypothetical protein